jgi:hypothetical protein
LHTAFAARILEEPDAWRLVEAPEGEMLPVPTPTTVPVSARLAN